MNGTAKRVGSDGFGLHVDTGGMALSGEGAIMKNREIMGATDPAKVRDALAATKDFGGVTGKITIDEKRNATKSAVVLQVKGGTPTFATSVAP